MFLNLHKRVSGLLHVLMHRAVHDPPPRELRPFLFTSNEQSFGEVSGADSVLATQQTGAFNRC